MTYKLEYRSDNGNYIVFHPDNDIVISNATGLTENEIQLSTSQGSGQIGTSVQGEAVQGKTLVFDGMIVGETAGYRKMLLDTISPLTGGTLIYNDTLYLRVRPQTTPAIERKHIHAKFQFSVYASYPYWTYEQESESLVSGIKGAFRFPVNYSNPEYHIWGRQVETEFVLVKNTGNVPARIIVTFIANTEVENPKVTLITPTIMSEDDLEFIRIRKIMRGGDKIVIDNTDDTVKITSTTAIGTEDGFKYLDINSSFFDVPVGETEFKADADVNRGGLTCMISFAPTVSGAF